MENLNIGDWFSKETGRVNREISGQVYFTSQRKLQELKRARKQTAKQGGLKEKQLMMFAIIMALVAPLVLNGCSSTQSTNSSSNDKSKSGYEKGRASSSGGY